MLSRNLLFLGILFFMVVVFSSTVLAQSSAQPWDVLRPLSEAAKTFDYVMKPIVFVLSLALFVIAVLAYRKTRSKRLLLVMLAFLFFAVKWGVKVVDMFVSPGSFLADPSENIFEFAILVLLFAAIFRK